MSKIFNEATEEHSLAWEVCAMLKEQVKGWKIAFFTTAGVEVLTVIGFLLYLIRN